MKQAQGGAVTPWANLAPGRDHGESGFTLIELVVVTVILPIVVGAITMVLISVFSLDNGVSNRFSDSADAQIVSSNFEKDVESASMMIAPINGAATNQSPATCATTGTEVLSLQVAGAQGGTAASEISYVEVQSGSSWYLYRNVCSGGSTTPTSSTVVSYDMPAPSATTSPMSITCQTTLTSALSIGVVTALSVNALPLAVTAGDTIQIGATTFQASGAAALGTGAIVVPSTNISTAYPIGSPVVDNSWAGSDCGANSGWISSAGVTGVALSVTEPASNYLYKLVALPGANANLSPAQTVAPNPNTSCGFANPGTGTFASTLCFVDFTNFNQPSNAAESPNCQSMSAAVADTPYTLNFCISWSGGPIAGAGIPTYFNPPTSEAFLGNNNFYTGIPGNPALYQTTEGGSATTVTITNIQVEDGGSNPATGWELVTGDAESTDSGESITWSTGSGGPALTLLDNTPTSPVGNACDSTPPSFNSTYLTGVGTSTVECQSGGVSSDKTGTAMLEALDPTSLTVTLVGTGLQAMFLGLLLPS